MKGKVKSIETKDVSRNKQLLHSKYGIVTSEGGAGSIVRLSNKTAVDYRELKTLVVEYEELDLAYNEDKRNLDRLKEGFPLQTKQLPLKYSQWQEVIDNNEIDTDKEIEFELAYYMKDNTEETLKEFMVAKSEALISSGKAVLYAKIVPKKKYKLYSKEEIEELLLKFSLWENGIIKPNDSEIKTGKSIVASFLNFIKVVPNEEESE